MTRYRKRAVVISAEQWWPAKPVDGVLFPVPAAQAARLPEEPFDNCGLIETLEGPHRVSPGSWIITGVASEKYPCAPEIFAQTYDEVEEENVR